MTFFEYKTTLAKIETSNYSQLRRLHTKLKDKPLDNFYSIHAINKTITKFKQLTSSHAIRNKHYEDGTHNSHFIKAVLQTTSKEEIVSLITDFSQLSNMYFELPNSDTAIVNLSTLLTDDKDCKVLDKVSLKANYYSIGRDNMFGYSLAENQRLVLSIIAYLDKIEGTPLYNYLLNRAIENINCNPNYLFGNMDKQYEMYKNYTKALDKAYTILTNTFNKDT